MKILSLNSTFAICKLKNPTEISLLRGTFFFAKTDDEISLVTEEDNVPATATDVSHGWKCLKIDGRLDFSLVGILAGITSKLAENGIPVFAVSTFDTDYFLVKSEHFEKALGVLAVQEINVNSVLRN